MDASYPRRWVVYCWPACDCGRTCKRPAVRTFWGGGRPWPAVLAELRARPEVAVIERPRS